MGNESNRRPQSAGRRDSARHAAMVKARNKRIVLMTVGLCLCLVLVAGIITGLYLLRKPKDDGKILDNVLVGGVSIGGMTREDAENAIRLSVEPVITGKSMLVRLDNETLELTPAQTGIELDVEDLVEAAYNYGRTGTRMEQNLARAQAKQQSYTIALLPYLRLNLGTIRSAVEEFCNGYNVEILKNDGPGVMAEGLKYVHNDTCVPALLVIGQFLDALHSGKYDLNKVALAITQTGGGCRASNYIHLLRKALKKAGYGHVPVISMRMRIIMKNARTRPSSVILSAQNSTNTVSPSVKKIFSTAVNTRIIIKGFMPRKMLLTGIWEMAMQMTRNASITP